LGDANLKK
jgi:hypothetical protein